MDATATKTEAIPCPPCEDCFRKSRCAVDALDQIAELTGVRRSMIFAIARGQR